MTLREFNIDEAKANLSKLVDAAASGEEIIIARSGRPLAQLIAFREPEAQWEGRAFGSDPNLKVPEDFDDPLPPGVLASFLE